MVNSTSIIITIKILFPFSIKASLVEDSYGFLAVIIKMWKMVLSYLRLLQKTSLREMRLICVDRKKGSGFIKSIKISMLNLFFIEFFNVLRPFATHHHEPVVPNSKYFFDQHSSSLDYSCLTTSYARKGKTSFLSSGKIRKDPKINLFL